MICIYCKSDIDNDSFHCDQCGKEIFLCPNCKLPQKGKHCVEDQGKLYSPKQMANSDNSPGQNDSVITGSQNKYILSDKPIHISPGINQIPKLNITNSKLNIDIEINDGDILGRSDGKFSYIFKQFPQVSSRHAQFNYDNANGWMIKDFGSTNGSAVSDSPSWQSIPKLKQGVQVQLKNNSLLLLANIEFQIKIILPQTTTGTQRL